VAIRSIVQNWASVTQTQPPPISFEPQAAWPPRAERQFVARVVIGIEAALMTYLAVNFLASAASARDGATLLPAFLATGGSAVLIWGVVHMGRDHVRQGGSTAAPKFLRGGAAARIIEDGRAPWDWTDFIIFWPGAFVASAAFIQAAVPLADLGLTGVDSAVRTAVESFVQAAMFYSGGLLNIYVLVGLRRGATLQDLGWRRFKWWWLPLAVVAALATLNIADYLQQISQHLLPNQVNQQCITVRHEYGRFIALAIVVVCVMAPLAEETIFRGFVYGWLRRWSPSALAIPISGAVFAAVHQELLLMLPLFAVGCVLGLLYQGSKTLWPGAVVHALFNLPGVIAILNATSC
jgi:membrane protease YdiL (CAAX protease family)